MQRDWIRFFSDLCNTNRYILESHLKERLTDTERRTLTIVIAPPKYSSGELNMDAPKY